MLTKQDLSQIKNIIQPIIKPIYDRLDKIDNKLTEHDKKFDKIDNQFKQVNKNIDKTHKDIIATIDFFDINGINDRKRLDRIEIHLGLPKLQII